MFLCGFHKRAGKANCGLMLPLEVVLLLLLALVLALMLMRMLMFHYCRPHLRRLQGQLHPAPRQDVSDQQPLQIL